MTEYTVIPEGKIRDLTQEEYLLKMLNILWNGTGCMGYFLTKTLYKLLQFVYSKL